MADTYTAIIKQAALDVERAIRSQSWGSPTVWAIPTTAEANGRIVVADNMPAPNARVIRPCDNMAMPGVSRWGCVPYADIFHVLYNACRREPILPIH